MASLEKTARQWLDMLPEPYRCEAFENTVKSRGEEFLDEAYFQDIPHTLLSSFHWETSLEGHTYWTNICRTYNEFENEQ